MNSRHIRVRTGGVKRRGRAHLGRNSEVREASHTILPVVLVTGIAQIDPICRAHHVLTRPPGPHYGLHVAPVALHRTPAWERLMPGDLVSPVKSIMTLCNAPLRRPTIY